MLLAHQFALASPLITADMVEASEYPHLSGRYHVHGVPKTVINELIHVEGAAPEDMVLNAILTVMDDDEMSRLKQEWDSHGHHHD